MLGFPQKTNKMKNLIFGLIATMFIAFNGNAQDLSNIGIIHNECLELYFKSGHKASDFVNVNDFMKDYYNVLKEKFSGISEDEFIKELKMNFIDDLANSSSKFSLQKQLKKMHDDSKISLQLYESILEITNSENEFDKILQIISSLESSNLSSADRKIIEVFKSVFFASNNYWTNLNSTYGMRLRPGSWTIIGDAVGAIVFCYIPPFAGFMAGAISLAVHNSEQDKSIKK